MQDTFKVLKDKYAHLEFSILSLSKALKDNETKRLDSEYFKKEYLEKIEILQPISTKLKHLMNSGYYGILPKSDDYTENGLALVRGKDLREINLEISNLVKVPFSYFQERYEICKNDILFLVKGATIGYEDGVLFMLDKPSQKMIFNGSIFKLQVKNINPAFLYIFMMTKYFTFQKTREVANNGIEYNSLPTIKNFLIPLFDSSFQAEIEKIVKNAHHKLEQSKALYKEAENLLYESLDLPNSPLGNHCIDFASRRLDERSEVSNTRILRESQGDFSDSMQSILQNLKLKFPHLNISIKPLSKSLRKSGRLDSEYYQAKYENIEALIKSHLCEKLGSLVNIKKSIEPGSEAYQNEGIEFVRVSNLSKFGISKSDIYLSREKFGKDLANLAPQKETILLSKDGSVGISYCVEEDLDCITSGAILHLKVKDKKQILPQVLSLILNSITTQLQAERDSGGSIIAHWKISEIENILIPLLDSQIQGQIASKLKLSFALKKEAKELLEKAKNKVESAIENKNC